MHDAYEVSNLLKLTVQIESIAAYEDNLLVGTRQGHLLMYSVSQRSIDQKYDVQLLRYNKTFSRKPIQQLDVITEYQLLVCLTDNLITIHDITTINFHIVHQATRTKGATLFCLGAQTLPTLTGETSLFVRLCVSVKRKLQFYYWKNNTLLPLMDDIDVRDIPKALGWCSDTICVGFRGDYTLITLQDNKATELFPTGKTSEPCITKISESTFGLGRDLQTVLVNNKGDAEKHKALKWTEAPLAMAWDEPYAVGLLPEALEVHTIEPCGCVQTSGVSKARLIVRCKQGLLYAASVSQVWCIRLVDIAKQRQVLLSQKQFEVALKLTELSDESEEDKKQKIHQIQTLYAHNLFENKKFRQSMQEFLKLETGPYDVIRLFPDLLPQQSCSPNEPEAAPAVKLQDRDLEKGLLALIGFLTESRLRVLGVKWSNTDTTPNNIKESQKEREPNSKATNQLLQIIDTTLLKCYLQTNDALVAPLLRLNHCHLSETEKTLKKYQKYSELIILYQTKNLHKKALELLQKQADEPDSSLRGREPTIEYLQHIGDENISIIFEFAGWVLKANLEDGLRIFTEDVNEVENLNRAKVLDFLLCEHQDGVIPYLEHVVNVWKDTNSTFHEVLIYQYRNKLQSLTKNASKTDKQVAENIRTKLLHLLETSKCYTPEIVLKDFPFNDLYEERALILAKLKKHKEVLSIYVQVLGDINRATEYCNDVSENQEQNSLGDDIYVTLIQMLLAPSTESLVNAGVGVSGVVPSPETVKPDLEAVLHLLQEHGHKIAPTKALAELPDSVKLVEIRHFLESAIRALLSDRRETQVLKGLLHAEHLKTQELRMMYEGQHVLLSELNVCPVCKKRFGSQSAFVRYPNGDVVHYSCQDKRN